MKKTIYNYKEELIGLSIMFGCGIVSYFWQVYQGSNDIGFNLCMGMLGCVFGGVLSVMIGGSTT
jgi:hypothetical protein